MHVLGVHFLELVSFMLILNWVRMLPLDYLSLNRKMPLIMCCCLTSMPHQIVGWMFLFLEKR
ncbi:unnamed protein product [Linum tenue]|uniref:Uncharacterized protein n=1 Tax=Linum tenue TaxID=586396 RepID=A0AAV0I1M5_9ROSI|nr:unnamed protein product [Linum tenue]